MRTMDSTTSIPIWPASSSSPTEGETYALPARAARRACVAVKTSPTSVAICSSPRSRTTRRPSRVIGTRRTTFFPCLWSSRASLYIAFGSPAARVAITGPSPTCARSARTRRASRPLISADSGLRRIPSKKPHSRTRRASSGSAGSRKKRMEARSVLVRGSSGGGRGCGRAGRAVLGLLVAFGQLRHGDDPVPFGEVDELDAHRRAARLPHVGDREADEDALLRDDEEMVPFRHGRDSDDRSVLLRDPHVDNARAAACLVTILGDVRPLAEAFLGDREERARLLDEVHLDDDVVPLQLDPLDARRATPHGPRVGLGKLDPHAEARAEKHLPRAVRDLRREQLVVVLQLDRDDALLARVAVGREHGLLDEAALRREKEIQVVGKRARRRHRGHALPLPEREEVHERLPARRGAAGGNVVELHPVDPPLVREREEVVVRGADEQVLDDVLFLRLRPHPVSYTHLRAHETRH